MQLIREHISVTELKHMSEKMFGGLVKAVVDIEEGIMVVDAGMHYDEEEMLIEFGSQQNNLWGINLHPDKFDLPEWIEFDSMINIRPLQGNRSRSIESPHIQEQIRNIVKKLVIP